MTKTQRVTIATTGLEVVGACLLTASAWLAFGLAGALAAIGCFCVTASYVLSRGSR